MATKEELIRALSEMVMTDAEKAAQEHYKFEEITINDQRASRMLDIKQSAARNREFTAEMSVINSLSKFLHNCNTEESRKTDTIFRRLCKISEENDELFTKLYNIAKDVTDRMRSMAPDSPQRLLLVIYTENSLNALEKQLNSVEE